MKAATGPDWRGNDGLPNFGRKARKWFARLVRAKIEEGPSFGMTEEEREKLIERFLADPMPYVTWTDAEEYHGRGWSNGAWSIDWNAVREGCQAALEELRAEAETARFPTLDDWLRAELEGTLSSHGASGGSEKLSKKLRRELLAAARARRKNRPRICRSCRAEFTPTSNRALRCTKCIDSESATNQATVARRPTNRRSS